MSEETVVLDAPPPETVPSTTATGKPRTPSTPGRKPGQKTATPKSVPVPGRPPAPRKVAVKDHRPAVEKSIRKISSSLLLTAQARNNPMLAADAIALLQQKDAWAECLNALAQDSKWLAAALEKAAVIAPGVELASLAVGLAAQIGVNHNVIPVELAKLLDAKDPRDLLSSHGINVVDAVPDEPPGV